MSPCSRSLVAARSRISKSCFRPMLPVCSTTKLSPFTNLLRNSLFSRSTGANSAPSMVIGTTRTFFGSATCLIMRSRIPSPRVCTSSASEYEPRASHRATAIALLFASIPSSTAVSGMTSWTMSVQWTLSALANRQATNAKLKGGLTTNAASEPRSEPSMFGNANKDTVNSWARRTAVDATGRTKCHDLWIVIPSRFSLLHSRP